MSFPVNLCPRLAADLSVFQLARYLPFDSLLLPGSQRVSRVSGGYDATRSQHIGNSCHNRSEFVWGAAARVVVQRHHVGDARGLFCGVCCCDLPRTSLDAVIHFLRHDFANFFHYNDMIDVHPPGSSWLFQIFSDCRWGVRGKWLQTGMAIHQQAGERTGSEARTSQDHLSQLPVMDAYAS